MTIDGGHIQANTERLSLASGLFLAINAPPHCLIHPLEVMLIAEFLAVIGSWGKTSQDD